MPFFCDVGYSQYRKYFCHLYFYQLYTSDIIKGIEIKLVLCVYGVRMKSGNVRRILEVQCLGNWWSTSQFCLHAFYVFEIF